MKLLQPFLARGNTICCGKDTATILNKSAVSFLKSNSSPATTQHVSKWGQPPDMVGNNHFACDATKLSNKRKSPTKIVKKACEVHRY